MFLCLIAKVSLLKLLFTLITVYTQSSEFRTAQTRVSELAKLPGFPKPWVRALRRVSVPQLWQYGKLESLLTSSSMLT